MYKLADGSLSTDYKVGDEFEVVGDYSFTKGSVVALLIDDESEMPKFRLMQGECADGRRLECFEAWRNLKPHRKQFTKADLKDGMVVTYRDGEERIVIGGILYRGENGKLSPANYLTSYDENLDRNAGDTIIKVSYMNETLWEREDTEKQKEVKRLRGVIEDAQKALSELEGNQ